MEAEHFLGVLDDLQRISTEPPTVITYDAQDPHRVLSRMKMVEEVDPTPACPYVSSVADSGRSARLPKSA